MALRAWLRKHEVFDRDLVLLFPKYNVNDPDKDLKNLTHNQWNSIQQQIRVERANLLKDKKAKARLEKKFSKITKIWRKKGRGKHKKKLKKKLKKMAKDPLLHGRETYGTLSREWEEDWKQQQNDLTINDEHIQVAAESQVKSQPQKPMQQTAMVSNDDIEPDDMSNHSNAYDEYMTIKINVRSLTYNKLTDTYSISLDRCKLTDNDTFKQIVSFDIDSKHINIDNESNNILTLNEIDNVLNEIEMNENKLTFDSKNIALQTNDKLLIYGFIREIEPKTTSKTPIDLIVVITNYIQYGYYCNHLINIGVGGGGCRMLHEIYNNQLMEYQSIASQPSYKYTKICSNAASYFDISNEAENGCKAKSIFVDLERKVVDKIFVFDKQREDLSIYRSSDCCLGVGSGSNNWAKGHYTDGAEIIDATMDIIRSQIEKSGIPKAFQIIHSMSGGTGGGLGTLIMMKCRHDFNINIPIHSFSLFPSIWQAKGMQFAHWPINVVLALHEMHEFVDGVFALDFDCLFNVCSDVLHIDQPKGQDLNFVAYQAISDIVSVYPVSYSNMFKYLCPTSTQIPFQSDWERERYFYSPNLKYYTVSHVPIYGEYNEYGSRHHNPYNINMDTGNTKMIEMSNIDSFGNTNNIISKLFDKEYNFSSHIQLKQGSNISTVMIHRGENLGKQKESIIKASERILSRKTSCFNPVPLNLFINSSPMYTGRNATMISNSTTIGTYFERIQNLFTKLWRRRTHHRLYYDEGMDATMIEEAAETVKSIIDSYKRNH